MKLLSKNILFSMIILSLSLFSFAANESKKVAMVRLKRGSAEGVFGGKSSTIDKGEWIKEGTVIKTGSKSFVKLSFIDKSSMNIGPNSEVVIEKFNNKEAGVINVLSGKIRSQVTKNYLNMDKDKSKLFVKSKSAVMGIRGTDFMFATSKATGATTAVLFEGSVVFNKMNEKDRGRDLESIVNEGRRINPGQFSVARRDMKRATVPSKMSSKQFYRLEKNNNFESEGADRKVANEVTKSIVPKGLSGDVVKGENKGLLQDVKVEVNSNSQSKIDLQSTKGFVKGSEVKPTDGSFVHIESGTVIPMGGDSYFDETTNEWSSNTNGAVDASGEYVPPVEHKITDQGDLIKIDPTTGEKVHISTKIAPVDSLSEFGKLGKETSEGELSKEGPEPAGEAVEPDKNQEGFQSTPMPVDGANSIKPGTTGFRDPVRLPPKKMPRTKIKAKFQ